MKYPPSFGFTQDFSKRRFPSRLHRNKSLLQGQAFHYGQRARPSSPCSRNTNLSLTLQRSVVSQKQSNGVLLPQVREKTLSPEQKSRGLLKGSRGTSWPKGWYQTRLWDPRQEKTSVVKRRTNLKYSCAHTPSLASKVHEKNKNHLLPKCPYNRPENDFYFLQSLKDSQARNGQDTRLWDSQVSRKI